ncbi:MAG: HAD family hydrolase [Luminiphilus sp.]|jgi:HAD superfamily hydrolase (TIGR01549 family)|nr:HAD family hydrolase [Luminiphilus sp.]
MIKVITFDLDDTLWDVRPALVKAEAAQNAWLRAHYPKVLEALGSKDLKRLRQQVLTKDPQLAHQISAFRKAVLQQSLEETGIAPSEAQWAAKEAFEAFIARRHDVALYPESEPLLEELSKNYTLGALTNGNADVTKTPLGRFFDFALQAEEVGAAKPEPALFNHALQRVGGNASALIHIGDSHDHDVIGAYRAGIRSVWFTQQSDNSDYADHIIACLTELPALLKRL